MQFICSRHSSCRERCSMLRCVVVQERMEMFAGASMSPEFQRPADTKLCRQHPKFHLPHSLAGPSFPKGQQVHRPHKLLASTFTSSQHTLFSKCTFLFCSFCHILPPFPQSASPRATNGSGLDRHPPIND